MEELLENLWSCVPSKEDEAMTMIHRVIQHLDSGLTSEERDMCLHLLFQEERGIQFFVNAASAMKKIPPLILSFLSFLLEWFPRYLEKYIVTIKNIAVAFIKRNSASADEKDKSLDVMIAVVQKGPWCADLSIASIVAQLCQMTSHRVSKPTVLRKVYSLVGTIAEHMPHSIHHKADRLLTALLTDLDYQINFSSNVQFGIIEGCFEGLYGFLLSFPLDETTQSAKCKKIAEYIKIVLVKHDSRKKVVARHALKVLARHGDQLHASLEQNFNEWHEILKRWLREGKEERAVAKQAILSFYRVIAEHISEHEGTKDMLNLFCSHFKENLEASVDVDIMVKGFGLFAKPLKQQTPEEISAIFNILAQRSNEELGKSNHHKLADYLDSLSIFSAELGVIHNLQLSILEGLSVQLICQFAKEEHPSWQNVMVDAIICTLLRLSRCSGSALDMYMNSIVYQGIIRSVSHHVVEDAKILQEAGQKNIVTYQNYLPLWLRLISLNKSSKGFVCRDAPINERRDLSRKLIDKILQSILEIISRLDLSLQDNVTGEPMYHCNVEKCVEANNPQDFTVLVNLVNFTIDLMNGLSDQSPLLMWISPLIQLTIKLSSKHPLVSSFYKLLANIVTVAQKLDYFEEQKDEMEDHEWKPTVNLLSGFLYDVISRQAQYRDDLQISCLRLMLATPSCIAAPLLRVCATAFQSVFRVGCSMLSLGHEGLRTLARWCQDIPEEKMRDLLKTILPMFDNLLKTCDNVVDEDDEDNIDGLSMVRKVLQDKKKKRLWKQEAKTHIDTELVLLQKEVVLFLSTLDTSSCLALLDGSEDRVGVTAWQKDKLLSFPFPFPDMKVEVSLDDLLPRLVDLAKNCGDRQTRSAACEFLHAVIMFMLGKEKQLELAHQGRLIALWEHIFPTILSLACDLDLMVNQLFQPLGEQLAHWYSSRMHERSEQAHAFLTALLNGITHQTDAALRDYSASCLHEYTEWSRKQGHMQTKVEPVIKFVLELCHHPCPQKRMGAALAFNSMYSVLREDLNLVNEFWIELLYGLVTGLSMCSVTGENSRTEEQLEKSLKHILRVLLTCSNKFNQNSEARRLPKELTGGTLWHIVRWLLKYCTALNASCRRNCIKMVDSLSCYVTDCRSTKDFILRVVTEEGEDSLIKIAESRVEFPTTPPKFTWNEALNWVYSLIASMESYIWLLKVGTPPDLLFSPTNSKLLKALTHFLENVVQYTVQQTSLWRPKEMENFNFAKCCTIVCMMTYLTEVLDCGQGASLSQFWSSNFWQIMVYCCVWPSHVGFDSSSRNVEENLPTFVQNFLKSLVLHAPENVCDFKEILKSEISTMTPGLQERFCPSIQNDKILPKDRDLLKGLKIVHSVFEEAQTWSGFSGDTSLRIVFDSIVQPVINSDQKAPVLLSPLALAYASSMLELYFSTSTEIKPLLLFSINEVQLYRRGLEGDLTHGEHFVSCFEAVLVHRVLQEPKTFFDVLEHLLVPTTNSRHLALIQSSLKSQYSSDAHVWRQQQNFVACFFKKWTGFVAWSEHDCIKETWLISCLVQVVSLGIDFKFLQNCGSICQWITMLLTNSSRPLPLKTELLRCLTIVCSHSEPSVLRKCLLDLKNLHFPAESSEFKTGTEEFTNFVAAFEALLRALVITGSATILQLTVKMMSVDPGHVCRHLLPSTLKSFMNQPHTNQEHQKEALTCIFSMFFNEAVCTDFRLRILHDFLLRLMQFASQLSQISFATSVIKKLVDIISKRRNLESGDNKSKHILISQIGSWNLLHLIYGIPHRSLFEQPGSELVLAAFAGTDTEVKTGKELTLLLTRKALDAFQNPPNFANLTHEIREMYRQYFCAVYNMFATMVCNMKTDAKDAKFYDKFLFDESSRKIWRLLIDEGASYMLPFCHTEHLKNVKTVVSIRRKLVDDRPNAEKTLKLLESQSFTGSLENDITRFDFTHSKVLKAPGSESVVDEMSSIMLENDTLNRHECMATVCSVIHHLVDSGISPAPSAGMKAVLPGWMDSFKKSLTDPTCPRNTHLFLLRIVLNCQSAFSPYVIHFMEPVLDCAVRICLRNSISYLLGDVVCLLVNWTVEVPSVNVDGNKINRLFQFLVEKCPDNQRSVFKYHLELIKSVVEVWKELINPPYDTLTKMLENPDKKVGINLTAIMLFYGLTPWTDESKKTFISFLQKNLSDNVKEIFKGSAETLGLALKHSSEKLDGQLSLEDQGFIEHLEVYLKNMHLKNRDFDRFLTILYGIHESYPSIIDSFISTVLAFLDKTTDFKRSQCLGLLVKHLEALGKNPYEELKSRGFLTMLSDRNSDVQFQALQIVTKLAPTLSNTDLYEVIHEIASISCFVKRQARHSLYEAALIAFDRCSVKEEPGTSSDLEGKLYEESKALLLLGLVDSNKEIQQKSYLQWMKEERLSQNVQQRLISVFTVLYSPLTEQHFLSYSVPLLLQGTATTPDYQSVVFQHALDYCTYEDMPVISSWRAQHAQMAPMFAQTISSQMSRSDTFNSTFDSSHQLLATQSSLVFQPTADLVDGSQSSNPQINMSSGLVRSSFLFSQDRQSFNSSLSKSNYKQGVGFGAKRLQYVENDQHQIAELEVQGSNFRSNRYLGKDTANKVFSMANVRRAKLRHEMKKERAQRREGQISLHRKYRKGDFPDIQIKYADFVNPLMELAKRDKILARKIMVNIFVGVKKVLDMSDDSDTFQNQSVALLNNVLKLSTSHETSMIGACLEIAYYSHLRLDPDLVSETAVNSDLLAIGVLLLETYAQEDNDENIWLHLAELYDGLGERDVAHATLQHNLNLGTASKDALEAHAEEQWANARRLYGDALMETNLDKFYESCFECMSVLSEWKEINTLIRKEVDENLDSLWEIQWYERKLLPHLLKSEVFSLVQSGRDDNKFLEVLNSWLGDSIKGATLKEQFSEILAVLCLLKKKFAESRFFGGKTLTSFIKDWSDLSPLFRKRRESALLNVCDIAEVMIFLSEDKALQSIDDCSTFLKRFCRVLPVPQDSLMHWETRMNFRTACMKTIPDEMQTEVKPLLLEMQFSLIETALQQGNYNFAKRYLGYIKLEAESSSRINASRWRVAKFRERHQWAQKEKNPTKHLANLLQIWKQLDQVVSDDLDAQPDLSVTAHSTESNLSLSIRHLLLMEPNCLSTVRERSQDDVDWLCRKLQMQDSNSSIDELVGELETIGLKSLLHSKGIVRDLHSETNNLGEQTASAYLQVAQYCRQILESDSYLGNSRGDFAKHMVRSILSAMRLGSNRARQLFPLLLQFLNEEVHKDFCEKSATVPPWMFLSWIPQLLSLLDTQADVVGPVLLKIAEKYPNAISYPYSISKENNKIVATAKSKVVKKLDSLLERSSLQICLVKALSFLTYPSVILKDCTETLSKALKSSNVDWTSTEKIFGVVFEEISSNRSVLESSFLGKAFDSIKHDIRKLLQELDGAIKRKSKNEAKTVVEKIQASLKDVQKLDLQNIKMHAKLKDFSPWLFNFSSTKMNANIEIPGQYSGDQKPTPERHILISQFGETVQIMPSIRKPVKLSIIGSDASNHTFLVKLGEDLRQDERVQQLLRLMNGIFSHNHRSRERQLSVVTYKVIPLTCRLGIIEWVHSTSALKNLMLSSLSAEEVDSLNSVKEKHLKWIKGDSESLPWPTLYAHAHLKISREEASIHFASLQSMVRADILRKALELWSSSAEAFYWLRHSFVTSYSTLCVAHWLLGVGDRHLSNCLVSQTNGQCIGIDFGHCFGTATTLPVPELVPFRLTPHIVYTARPYGTSGLIEETMVNALRALQSDSELLMATMQVFIHEPSVDWLNLAMKHNDLRNEKGSPVWLPVLKVKQALRKLKGVNPVVIVREDLETTTNENFKRGFLRTLKGDPIHNIRTKLQDEDLTPRQQVECLIDLATDPNILAKTWLGWESWM